MLTIENGSEILSWAKDSSDEIIVTCVYGEEAITNKAEIYLNAKSSIKYYGKEIKTANAEISERVVLREKIGDIITLDSTISEEVIAKGYMLEKNGKNTEFSNTLSLNIGYAELMDKVVFNDVINYTDYYGNKYPANPIYTYIRAEKDNLVEILGEDGYINILNKSGEKVSTLNKENLEIKFENEETELSFETSKPLHEGILKIENGRAIKPLEYAKAQTELFNSMKITLNASLVKDDKVLINGNKETSVEMTSPITDASLNINTDKLSTALKNENVELRVTLNTTKSSNALYKNPEVSVILPNYITDINIENVKLLYEKELKLQDAKIYRNENGNLVINIKLSGEQTAYNETFVTEGATLIMNSDITVNPNAPTGMQTIYLNVKNEKTNEELRVENDIKIIAPAGIATVSEISGYSDKGETAVSISNNVGVGEIKANAPAKNATVRMVAINNYEYDCDNVVILGRTPTEGNKKITKNEDLGSTFSLDVKSGIKSENGLSSDQMKVYYSANKEANTNLSDEANSWTSDINSAGDVASYMIVLDDYTFKSGEVLSFNYNAEIPANLPEDKETYGVFAVYYEEAKEDEAEEAVAPFAIARTMTGESSKVGLETEGELKIDVKLDGNELGNEVQELKEIEFTANITSSSNVDNAKLKINLTNNASIISEGATLDPKEDTSEELPEEMEESEVGEKTNFNVDTYTIPLTNIKKGNNEVKFTVSVGNYSKNNGENEDGLTEEQINQLYNTLNTVNISGVVEVPIEEGEPITFSGANSSKSFKITEIPDSIKMILSTPLETDSNGILVTDENKEVEYDLDIIKESSTYTKFSGVKVTCKLPDGVTCKEEALPENASYNKKTKTVTWDVGDLNSIETIVLTVIVGKFSDDLALEFVATSNETGKKEFKKADIKLRLADAGVELNQTSTITNRAIKAGEEITYTITARNLNSNNFKFVIKDYLPKELEFIKCKYSVAGKTGEINENHGSAIVISPIILTPYGTDGDRAVIEITAKATEVDKSVEITNKVEACDDLASSPMAISELKLTLANKEGGVDNPDPSDPGEEGKTYDITGTAWLDENKDGKRENSEKLLSDIKVYLLDSASKKIVSETTTNKNGVYEFKEVKKGNYVVAFEYDNLKYDVTLYRADGIENSANSDVVNMELKLNGDSKKYAVTDAFVLDTNTFNLDAGFIDSPKFDLELTKGISLIQVSNKQGTKDYNFKGKDSAKVEIGEKYIIGSVIAITYEIKVTNTGAVAGFANKIVDYKSKDLSFSSSLNPEWYEDADGNLYTTSLTGREIKPGETVTVSVILTKTMTSENIGVSNNTAEIADASNDLGLEDIDSVPGNRDAKEDDYGLADVYITIKTGGILLFGLISGLLIGIIALGAYMVNKKVLRKI